jgi:hypothetical protein
MNLETWLATATKNLAPKAVVKVREDISMHVETAVNRYQLERHSELEALELAVKDLGDAKIAARGFEKAYLTVSDMQGLAADQKIVANKIWFSVLWGVIFAYLMYDNFSFPSRYWDKIDWHFAIFALIVAVQFFLNGMIARKYSLRKYVLPRIIVTLIYFFSYILMPLWHISTFEKLNQANAKYSWARRTYEVIGSIKLTTDQTGFVVGTVVMILFGIFTLSSNYSKWRKLKFL